MLTKNWKSLVVAVAAVLFVNVLAWSGTATAAIFNHYTFDSSGSLGDDTAADNRDLTASAGGNSAQIASVTGGGGVTKTNVLRLNDGATGRFFSDTAGAAVTKTNFTVSAWARMTSTLNNTNLFLTEQATTFRSK